MAQAHTMATVHTDTRTTRKRLTVPTMVAFHNYQHYSCLGWSLLVFLDRPSLPRRWPPSGVARVLQRFADKASLTVECERGPMRVKWMQACPTSLSRQIHVAVLMSSSAPRVYQHAATPTTARRRARLLPHSGHRPRIDLTFSAGFLPLRTRHPGRAAPLAIELP